ncbi:uncharacterized protein LOC124307016 [Neodiprion virginianus]|uniref:uncharacterized protein LOC124307016 n=1 Tax=Neodiprion virginianus TaxID=2961670 RepID=UPI001EE743DF|nr:uncharacterized protein LOC124307016 [Neodiprion virginianus]
MTISDGLIRSIFISAIFSLSYSVTLNERGVRWLALGDEITEDQRRMENMKIVRYNTNYPISTTSEIFYSTKNDMRINYIVVAASAMKGFVSVEKGGIGQKWVTIKYTSENGSQDQLEVLIESYKSEPSLIVKDNSAKTLTTVIVMDEIRNWTEQILR